MAVLLSSCVPAREKPTVPVEEKPTVLVEEKPAVPVQEKSAEQLKKAKYDFARIGAIYQAVTDPLTKRVTHSFQCNSRTEDPI